MSADHKRFGRGDGEGNEHSRDGLGKLATFLSMESLAHADLDQACETFMFHIMPSTASIRQLRLEFPKLRFLIEREGEVIITERGRAAYVIRPYLPAKKRRPVRINYYERLVGYMPKPVSPETERFLDADRDES